MQTFSEMLKNSFGHIPIRGLAEYGRHAQAGSFEEVQLRMEWTSNLQASRRATPGLKGQGTRSQRIAQQGRSQGNKHPSLTVLLPSALLPYHLLAEASWKPEARGRLDAVLVGSEGHR